MASPSARKKFTSVVRVTGPLCAMASASRSVNRISGTIAPDAAAPTGLAGTSEAIQVASVCCWSPESCRAASAAPGGRGTPVFTGSKANRAGAAGMMTIAVPTMRTMKTTRVRAPSRPMALTSVAEATPVITRDTTSGITVIRMAFTHRVPNGASASAAPASAGLPVAAMSRPSAPAAPSETRTRVLSFIGSHHQAAVVDIARRTCDVAGPSQAAGAVRSAVSSA